MRYLNNIKRGIFLGLMIIVMSAVTVSASAADSTISLTDAERAWIKANPRIRVHNEMDWPPFNFAREDQAQGYSIDFMNLVASSTGLQVDYVTGPTWGEFLELMKSGKLDVMLNIVKTPARQKYLLYTRPYADNPNTILSRRDAPYDSLEQLFGKTISVPKGFFYEEILKREYPKIKLHLVKDTLETMKAVTFGKADAALGELAVFNHLLGAHLMTGLGVSGEVKMGNPEYALLNMATRTDTPLLASILDKGIKSITIEQIRAIQRKWLGETRVSQDPARSMALTSAQKDWLVQHPVIRLGIDPDYPPFEFESEDGKLSGISADYLRLINKRLGTDIKVVPGLKWPEVIAGVEAGSVDILSAALRSPVREKFLLFSKPHLEFPVVILTRDDYPFVANLDDLTGKKIALVRDFSVTDLIRKNFPQVVPHMVDTPLAALQAVSVGDAEAAVINLAVATNFIRTNNLINIKVAAPAGLDIKGLAFAVRKDWPELVGILNKALASITPEEEAQIRNRWISVRYEHVADTEALVKVALQVGAVAVVILLLIVFWNRRLRQEIGRREATETELTEKEALLRLALAQMSDGIYQLDNQLRYTLFNDRYVELVDVPQNLVQVGMPVERVVRHLAQRGDYGEGEIETLVQKRLREFILPDPISVEVTTPDKILEFRQTPAADGGMVAVASDITERKQYEEILRKAKDDAEASAQAKSDFIAVVSHEVRTPMNGVLGMARLMLETPLIGEQVEYAQTIVDSGEALLTILNDLLDISKLEAGKLEIEAFAFAPRRLIADTGNVMRPRAVEKGLKTQFRVGDNVPLAVIGDANRLRQIVFNLLSNAIKFTDRGEVEIAVEAQETGEDTVELIVSVTDTGAGIDPESADKLFAPYVQANVDIARRYGGTGLGLSISRRLAGLMGGYLTLQSEVGKGSTFTLTVPFETTESIPTEARDNTHWTDKSFGRGLRILLVEDNRINRKVAEGMIGKLGHKLVAAENGQEALEKIATEDPFDVVLMDRHMPVMDGIEATRRIRAMEGIEGTIPIIAVTAAATQREVETCLEAGMNDVVTKPIDPRLLDIALKRISLSDEHVPDQDVLTDDTHSADAAVLDLGVIDALNKDYGEDSAAEFFDMFREIAPEAISGFQAAVVAGDVGQMTHFSHDLKSSAANVGLMRLSGLCRDIEMASDDGRMEEACKMGEALPVALAQALRALVTLERDDVMGTEPADAQALFLAKMGHDLRNVMNNVTGYVALLQEDRDANHSPETVAGYAAEIRRGGDRMQGMSECMFDLIQLQAGTWPYKAQSFDLNHAVQDCIAVSDSQGNEDAQAADQIRIDFQPLADSVQAYGDPAAFRKMLTLLLLNATSTSAAASEVRVHLDTAGPETVLVVSDQGSGIGLEVAAQINDPYGSVWQGSDGTSVQNLRFAVAAGLAALAGSSLGLADSPEGGTRASVSLKGN
ncbi:MAG: transporter substrate-binding domain-containing protein [Alphaproteobacteria bacterium]|nr:transporter substrate-binding domain-containing protein [Alphaproteobacteria bacterium]MBT4965655.1 transporter substrate-binding domain-containing protein [Alphaproteobacteria bacterium]MBT5159524.1 transporter substrate-binding domain-containing protein [Alphaproteobacteria bacterium]MBT5917366.1 transporter substrate-binding domain-containing protein [Alphaproteobacteria bacterium]